MTEKQRAQFEQASQWYREAEIGKESPFCAAKGLPTYRCVRVHWDDTLIPIINVNSELIAYMALKADPSAKFGLTVRGTSKGGLIVIHSKTVLNFVPTVLPSETYFCEGFETGCTIHEKTGNLVICCLNLATVQKRIIEVIGEPTEGKGRLYAELRSKPAHLEQSRNIAHDLGMDFRERI